MRELTKSMTRFSLSMAALGLQQTARLLRPGQALSSSAATMEALSEAAAGELGETLGGLFREGDRLQGAMVDAAARLASAPGAALRGRRTSGES